MYLHHRHQEREQVLSSLTVQSLLITMPAVSKSFSSVGLADVLSMLFHSNIKNMSSRNMSSSIAVVLCLDPSLPFQSSDFIGNNHIWDYRMNVAKTPIFFLHHILQEKE